jgi:hypothetical protein
MDERYQVFVTSTYSDFKEERERVINELTRVGYIAVGMEQFPATDETQPIIFGELSTSRITMM